MRRYFKEETRAVDKCDFCLEARLSKGETTTACVEACPADVRVFGNLADPKSRVSQLASFTGNYGVGVTSGNWCCPECILHKFLSWRVI